MKSFAQFFLLFTLLSNALAKRSLYSTSLVDCMANSTKIQPNYFNVVFNPETRALKYDISITAEIEGDVKAFITVYAFGFDIIKKTIDLCDLGWKQFCPITPSEMEVESIEYISEEYVNMIPNIAYVFPDIDAVARLIITNENDELLGCLQCSFTNGKTVSHEGAKWATAVVAGIGLLVSAALSLFGNSAAASRMSAAAISLFTYFQSVVIISMLHVQETPAIASAWSENLAWSMGLIRITFMQKIFRWYIQATGGIPTQYLTSAATQVLTQRSLNYILNNSVVSSVISFFFPNSYKSSNEYTPYLGLEERASDLDSYFIPIDNVPSSSYLTVLRGIKRVAYKANIEPTSVVCTGFTFFTLCLYVLVGLFFIFRLLMKQLTKNENSWFSRHLTHRTSWRSTFKGALARYIFIGFPQLVILSLWEFTMHDSGAIVTLSVFFLLLALLTMSWCSFKTLSYGRQSIKEHGNPAAILYGNPDVLSRYGFMYTMFNAKRFWFGTAILVYIFVKALFVSLAQGSGRTQALAIWILDMFYCALLCHTLPYLDKFMNVISIFIQVIITINSFLFTFFSGVYGQQWKVSAVMGIVFFIMNAAMSLILLVVILLLAVITVFSKNPDSRFSPTKDDRTSFQRKHQSLEDTPDAARELFELGQVAKEHNNNWATEMYQLKDLDDSNEQKELSPDEKDIEIADSSSSSSNGFGKFMSNLTRGKSVKNIFNLGAGNKSKHSEDDGRGENTSLPYEPTSFLPAHDNNTDNESKLTEHQNPFQPIGTTSGNHSDILSTDHSDIISRDPFQTGQDLNSSHFRVESNVPTVSDFETPIGSNNFHDANDHNSLNHGTGGYYHDDESSEDNNSISMRPSYI